MIRFLPNETSDEKLQNLVGIELDQPLGDCQGEFQHVQYFDCEPNKGLFVKFKNITVGDTVFEANVQRTQLDHMHRFSRLKTYQP